ncbi:unnamed protein product [Amoebophrya sp. A120]|nr:unnamed protein product [Amoebophrya sp. A120]|eukprot:GSA120T00019611001.1
MSSKGMDIVDCFAHDIFERLVDEATRLMRLNSRNTMTSREMQTACRLILPGQLAQHAIQDGTQAVRNYDEACGKVRDDDIFRNNEDGGQSVASSRMMGEDDTDDEDSEGDDDDMAEKFNKQKRKAAGDDKMKLPKNMDEDMMMFMDKTDKSMANKESFFDEAAMKKEKIMAQYHTDQMGDMMGMEKMEMPQ